MKSLWHVIRALTAVALLENGGSAMAECPVGYTCTPAEATPWQYFGYCVWGPLEAGSTEEAIATAIAHCDAGNWGYDQVGDADGLWPVVRGKLTGVSDIRYECPYVGHPECIDYVPNTTLLVQDFSWRLTATYKSSQRYDTGGDTLYGTRRFFCPGDAMLTGIGNAYYCASKTDGIIRLTAEQPSRHGGYLSDLAPRGAGDDNLATATRLSARVYDTSGRVIRDANIKIELQAGNKSGGHDHDDNDGDRPIGRINDQEFTRSSAVPVFGNTGSDGFSFLYTAPEVAGDYRVVVSCTDRKCKQQGPDTIWAGVQDLMEIPPSIVWEFVGEDQYHGRNHYIGIVALARLGALAALYKGYVPANVPVLHLNDASLERGGMFDCHMNYSGDDGVQHGRPPWWVPDHFEHRLGTNIDVRAGTAEGSIPKAYFRMFKKHVQTIGGSVVAKNPGKPGGEFHVRLLGKGG